MDPVDRRNLAITGRHRAVTDPHVTVENDVTVIITQAYGPNGDNLVGISEIDFDGHPAITIGIRTDDGREGLVHLSPIHGDGRKTKPFHIPHGTRCELLCPVSKRPLDLIEVEDSSGTRYYALYLTPQLSKGSMVMISDVWGHYHSRIIDEFELISTWAAQQQE